MKLVFAFFAVLFSFTLFAQKQPTIKHDTLSVKLTKWESEQLKITERTGIRRNEIRNEIAALQREDALLDDKEKSTWGAIYNGHSEIDRTKILQLLWFDPDNGIIGFKVKP